MCRRPANFSKKIKEEIDKLKDAKFIYEIEHTSSRDGSSRKKAEQKPDRQKRKERGEKKYAGAAPPLTKKYLATSVHSMDKHPVCGGNSHQN